MIRKEKFLEVDKACFEYRVAQYVWADPDFQKYIKDNVYQDSDAESAALAATGIFVPFDSVDEARKTISSDSEWLAEGEVEEEYRLYRDFEDYITKNYVIHEFQDGVVVVKDLFGFEMR